MTASLERTYDAKRDEIWEMWTTVAGIESWWGPEGYSVKVNELDLQPGGSLRYTMTATAGEQVAALKRAGKPLSSDGRIRFKAIEAPACLTYVTKIDFIPGVEPYEVATMVELREERGAVKMVITTDAMHDDSWTKRMADARFHEIKKFTHALKLAR